MSSIGGGLRSTEATEELRSGHVARCMERYPESGGTGPYFDTECSTLNPHNVGKGIYVYGTLPLFLARATGDQLTQITGDSSHSSFYGLHLVWRGLSALAETAIILVVFLIGVTLLDRRAALLAAGLYSVVVLSIQQAHFGTVDAITNLCCALGLLFAARVWKAGRLSDHALFGLVCGCALASRINVAPLAGLVLLAPLPTLAGHWRSGHPTGDLARKAGVGLVAAGLLTLLTFRVLNPYAFSGPGFFGLTPNLHWLEDLVEARRLVSGLVDIPPNWQWLGRAPWLFPLNNILLWGLGPALGLTAAAGTLWALLRLLQRRPDSTRVLLPLVWAAGYFALLGGGHVASMRYFLPLYPALTLLAAWCLLRLVQINVGWRRTLALVVIVVVPAFTLVWALMFSNIYRHQLTRVQASHWFWERVPGDFAMRVESTEGEPPLINIPVANRGSHGDLPARASRYETGQPFSQYVRATADGLLRSVHIPHLGDPLADSGNETLSFVLADPVSGDTLAAF
ncbi:MAG: glycosyltransferase family 39 protein, partial [Anaerolineaceae bacterium]|nr:glycosyltransferase family 39 protein [Anaerolineaceae bacterium]